MDGERTTVAAPPPRALQPGGREPAPGDLRLVQAFINTHFDLEQEHGADLLATATGARTWLVTYGLLDRRSRVTRTDHERLLRLREELRELARANRQRTRDGLSLGSLNDLAEGAPVEMRFEASGPRFTRATRDVRGVVGLLLALSAKAILEGSWFRLKVCPGPHCDWAFYDHSRNQTSRWCSMAVCGSRSKARRHYRRKTGRDR
jgi:predicted RNA-binding Zn ribbon-like protein